METKGKDFFKLIYPTETIHIDPVSHDIGYCVDGDFNSITIIYINNNEEIPKLSNEFCCIETFGWLVEKSSITNVSIEFEKNTTEIKLLIHFHSKMIRDSDDIYKIKKKINRTNNIKNILKK